MRGCWLLGIAALALGGCSSRFDPAVAACEAVLAKDLAGRAYTIDREEMNRNLSKADGLGEISSTVWFNKGFPNELSQPYICAFQYSSGGTYTPVVTSVRFQWWAE